jgi:DNA-binding response OmpR family regulator
VTSILVIEDDSAVAALLRAVLKRAGHEVIPAGSGEEGLEHIDARSPDAVILDIRLPGIDGFAVLERIRARGPRPPVVMLTADRDTRERALAGGADAHLGKPFNNVELVALIGRLTTHHL